MILEYQQNEGFDCIKEFLKNFDDSKSINYLGIPASLGDGFMKRIDITDGLWILFHFFTLLKTHIMSAILSLLQLIFHIRFINYLFVFQILNSCFYYCVPTFYFIFDGKVYKYIGRDTKLKCFFIFIDEEHT